MPPWPLLLFTPLVRVRFLPPLLPPWYNFSINALVTSASSVSYRWPTATWYLGWIHFLQIAHFWTALPARRASSRLAPIYAKNHLDRTSRILERVHTDLCGPMSTPSIGGAHYIATFIDDYSRLAKVYLLKSKGQLLDKFNKYNAWATNSTGLTIKALRSDHGGEYISEAMEDRLGNLGITHEKTAPYTSSQNPIAERRNLSLVSDSTAMLCHADMPKKFWGEAVVFSNHIHNCTPTKAVRGMTPYEAWYREKPDLSDIHVFGCRALALLPETKLRKFDPRTRDTLYLGPSVDSPGHRLWTLDTKKVIISRSVRFFETQDVQKISLTNTVTTDLFVPSTPYVEIDNSQQLLSTVPVEATTPGPSTVGTVHLIAGSTTPSVVPDISARLQDVKVSYKNTGGAPASGLVSPPPHLSGDRHPVPTTKSVSFKPADPIPSVPSTPTYSVSPLDYKVSNTNTGGALASGLVSSPPHLCDDRQPPAAPTSVLVLPAQVTVAPAVPAISVSPLDLKSIIQEHGGAASGLSHSPAALSKDRHPVLAPSDPSTAPPRSPLPPGFSFFVPPTPADPLTPPPPRAPASPAPVPRRILPTRDQLPRAAKTAKSFIAASVSDPPLPRDPLTYAEAMAGPLAHKWKEAVDLEMQMLNTHRTFDLTDLPPDRKAVDVKWIFKTKRDSAGKVLKYKARLVAKGFLQKKGKDYGETFAPVARMTSVRIILAIAAAKGYTVEQLDVDSAYLNGLIDKEIYMKQPTGFVKADAPHLVCRLNKGLYGLKQAGRIWNDLAHSSILEAGFTRSNADPCVYVRFTTDGGIILGLYVDDFIIAGVTRLVKEFIAFMRSRFSIKELGQVEFILGVQVTVLPTSISICQSTYISDLVSECGMSDSYPQSVPVAGGDLGATISEGEGDNAPVDPTEYRHILGKVMYAMVSTRPDIAYAVGLLGRHSAAPTTLHLGMAKRLLRYLNTYPGACITYPFTNGEVFFKGYSDSDWAGSSDRRSTGGYTFFINDAPISWSSKRQDTVALSTAEAEYIALCNAGREASYLRVLLSDLGYPQTGPTTIYEDNQPAIDLARNPVRHARSKHISIQYHWIRERVLANEFLIVYCPTERQLADIFTKALARDRFHTLVAHFLTL